MNRSWQVLAVATLLSSSLLCAGCKRKRPRELLPTPLGLAPPDGVAEGELDAGPDRAFGFVLPRGMRITARMNDTVYATGRLGFAATKRYLREQVIDAKAVETATRLSLDNATVAHSPKHKVMLVVSMKSGKVELMIRDRRRKEAEPGLSEEERWRRAGLTTDGQVVENQAQ